MFDINNITKKSIDNTLIFTPILLDSYFNPTAGRRVDTKHTALPIVNIRQSSLPIDKSYMR